MSAPRILTATIAVLGLVILSPIFAVGSPPSTSAGSPVKPTAPGSRVKPETAHAVPIGFPQDAGTHDSAAVIEWWYYNALLKSSGGHRYAVVASYFRTGLPTQRKGHYLIYSLADLDLGTSQTYSVVDQADAALLKLYLPLMAMQHPENPRTLDLLGSLQSGHLPPPHRLLSSVAAVHSKPPFSITMEENSLTQTSPDALSWAATLTGRDTDWTLEMSLEQPSERPPMLVGGTGRTGLSRPDDMYYLSLTGMAASATLTSGGVVEKLTGLGWLDRQWGTSWVVQDNGWDWFGLHLSDESDLIVYRIRDNKTGKILRTEATILAKDGTQTVDSEPTIAVEGPTPPAVGATTPANSKPANIWTDPASGIAFPQAWVITLPKSGLTLTVHSEFPEQAIPVIGIGDAIWEGAVSVTGNGKDGAAISGLGYMELVGYRKGMASAFTGDKK